MKRALAALLLLLALAACDQLPWGPSCIEYNHGRTLAGESPVPHQTEYAGPCR